MQDVFVYLKVNKSIYNDDEKKISFILSYLADGDAAVWKQQFIQTKIEESVEAKTDEPSWGNYKEFVEALKKMFQPYDKLAKALEDMKKLCLGDGSITVMSMPDALPTEIALVALLLSKFQVYSTSLRHYYHRPITLSVTYTPHGIDQRPAIISQEVLLSIGLAPYTCTVQPHTASVTRSSIAVSSLDFYQFPQAYFHFNCTHQESWDPLTAVLRPSSIIMKQLSE
jgi:hypothetical protein